MAYQTGISVITLLSLAFSIKQEREKAKGVILYRYILTLHV